MHNIASICSTVSNNHHNSQLIPSLTLAVGGCDRSIIRCRLPRVCHFRLTPTQFICQAELGRKGSILSQIEPPCQSTSDCSVADGKPHFVDKRAWEQSKPILDPLLNPLMIWQASDWLGRLWSASYHALTLKKILVIHNAGYGRASSVITSKQLIEVIEECFPYTCIEKGTRQDGWASRCYLQTCTFQVPSNAV